MLPPKPRVHTRPVAEVLNSYRKYGLSSARYQFMTNEWGLCNEGGPHGPEIPGCDTVTQPPLTIKDAPHCRAIVPAWPAAAGSTARPTMAALAVQDVETGWLIGASGTVSIVASIVGSMVTDAIGVCTLVCNIARAPKPNRSTVFVQGLCTRALYKGLNLEGTADQSQRGRVQAQMTAPPRARVPQVRKTALIALSVALVGRSLWTFGSSHVA